MDSGKQSMILVIAEMYLGIGGITALANERAADVLLWPLLLWKAILNRIEEIF